MKGEGSVFHDEAGRERAAPVYSLMREDSAIFALVAELVYATNLKFVGSFNTFHVGSTPAKGTLIH